MKYFHTYISPQKFESEELDNLITADERGPTSKVRDQGFSQVVRDTARAYLPSFVFGFFCATLVFALYYSFSKSSCIPEFKGETYSPALHLIEPKNIVFTGGFGEGQTVYQGPSTPERDAAWEELYNFGVSRIPRSSAAKLVNRTVPIPGDPGYYVVSLNVFHQLHCVNMIRKRIWSNQTWEATHELMGIEHLSHCLDALRQSLMCSVDITPLPWQWDPIDKKAKEVAEVQHTCRNFEKVKQWALDNKVVTFDRNIFVDDDLDM